MKKSQRSRLAALAAQASRTQAEQSEHDSLATLAAANLDATKDTDEVQAPATVGSVLSAAFNSLRNKNAVAADLTSANAKVAALTGERDAATVMLESVAGELKAANSEVAVLGAQMAALAAFFGLSVADLKGKNAAETRSAIEQKISAAAVDLAAGQGVPAATLPKVSRQDEGESSMSRADFSKLSAHAARAFCLKGGVITD